MSPNVWNSISPVRVRRKKRRSRISRLESAGFVETSRKGSHVKFVRRLEKVVDTAIVPKKSEIPVGMSRSILNQAHIDPEEWERLR